ncbi:MAG: tryptophan-rich sensory protein [Anaerofustis sp.]
MKENNSRITLLRIMNLVFFLGMITVNALANILPINGLNTGEISDFYPNLFTPAALTFSIWGVIYLLLALFILYQFGLMGGKESTPLIGEIGVWFSVSCAANMLWILSWHHLKIGLSLIWMLLLLVSLIVIAGKVNGVSEAKKGFFLKLPFFVYFGWITVATIANVTAFLVDAGWSGFGLSEADWTVVILAVGTVIACSAVFRFKSAAYGFVVIWAYAGIIAKHLSPNGFHGAFPFVIAAAAICIVIILIDCFYVLFRRRRSRD